ncbi:DUF2142 domain-containing protein [Arthrobacter sp. SO5]|uniref:DUF2142 domain-containing protein n=1 Tax=Arthrobacter sp. SO5 TaxID=1897055 RepID=UPI001E531AE5|nr:DUF2142 domain-containing protein [Arthrobacter sp. SO5]
MPSLVTPPHREQNPRRGQLPVFVVAFVILGLLTTIWSLASPIMSLPDEPAHTIKAAAVARGQFSGESTGVQGELLKVRVPGYIADIRSQQCYAFKVFETPACAPKVDPADRGLTTGETSAGNYNPVYYILVGLPSRVMGGEGAIYTMRIISGLLNAAILASVFAAASALRRPRMPLIAAAVATTPGVLFLSGGINPNALEITTAAAVFMHLCVILEGAEHLRTVRWNIAALAVAASLLANTRPLSLLWLVLAVGAATAAFGVRRFVLILKDKFVWLAAGVTALSCAFALYWLLTAKSFDSLLASPTEIAPDQAFATMLDRTFNYVIEYVGVLGWLDTPAPAAVQMTWVMAFGLLLLVGLTSRPVRGRWGLALLVPLVIVLPAALQASTIQSLGWIWQGRYLMALVVVLLLAAGVAARFIPFRITPWKKSAVRWSLVLMGLAHLYLMLFGFRRYTVGIIERTNWTEMFDPTWQPPFTWQILTVAYIAVLAAGGFVLYRSLVSSPAILRRRPSLEVAVRTAPAGGSRVPEPVDSQGPARSG